MKELYISPDVEIVNFLAMQAIADTDQSQESNGGDWGENFGTIGGSGDDIN